MTLSTEPSSDQGLVNARHPEAGKSVRRREKVDVLRRILSARTNGCRDTYALSYGQEAMWFLYQSAPQSSAYHVAMAMWIRSHVDVSALHTAFGTLVQRHPVLRSTFTTRKGEPVQIVHENQKLVFDHVDGAGWTDRQLNEHVRRAYDQPFDLERGPVLRVHLFTRDKEDHVLLMTVHHIAFDGWSLWICQDELRQLYEATKAGHCPTLPHLDRSYHDHIRSQARTLAGPKGKRMWDYWQRQLSGDLPILNLPTDRPRPPVQAYHGGSHAFSLPHRLTQRLKALAQEEQVTAFTLLLAAFQTLLHRYTGQNDILIGSPTTGRADRSFRDVVGYFVNPVVLRADMAGNPRFRDFLTQAHQRVLGAIEHQDYPFPLLVKQLQPKRDPSYAPLVQASFVLQKPQRSGGVVGLLSQAKDDTSTRWGGLVLEHFDLPQQEGQYDLELEMLEAGGTFRAAFKYDTDLFEPATLERMAEQFQVLLESIAEDPDQRLGQLPLLSEAQRQQLLVTSNQTNLDCAPDACLHRLFEVQADKTPDAVAVVFEQDTLTYHQLNERANQLAHHLQLLGVGPDVLVGICVERSLEMVVGLLGILKAGGAYVPLTPNNPPQRLAWILQDTATSVLLTQRRWVDHLGPTAAKVVCLDQDWHEIAQAPITNPTSGATAQQLAYVIYTSGSTGKPKGVLVNHHHVVRLFASTQPWFHFDSHDVWTLFHSYAFDFSVWELWGALLHGGRLVVVPLHTAQSPSAFYELLCAQQVTVLNQTPSAFRALMHTEQRFPERAGDLSLRLIIFGGEALDLRSLRPWLDRHGDQCPRLVNMYGITETTVHVTYRPITSADVNSARRSLIGRPIPDLQLYVLDSFQQPVPIGVPGELCVGGAGVARGYLHRPQLTAQRFIPNPFRNEPEARLYRSGDLGRYLPDGDIEYLGRLDQQVKVRGFRIELGEIEAVLTQHAGVREAVVTVRDDAPGGEGLVAYVVPQTSSDADQTLTVQGLRQDLKQQLPDYAVPAAFVLLDQLPLNSNGKVDRRALPAPQLSRKGLGKGYVAPRNRLEEQLTHVWEQVLEVRPIGVRDDFFDLGGHSLLAVRVMAQIEQQFGQNLPMATLLKARTIEGLAVFLCPQEQRQALPWSCLVPIHSAGSRPPLFFIPGGGGNVLYFEPLARHLDADQPFYGLQSVGLDGQTEPYTRVQDMAAHYIHAIRDVQPHGPYCLGGHCFGSLIAFEMAQQLQKHGEPVNLVAVLDAPAPMPMNKPSQETRDDASWIAKLAGLLEELSGKQLDLPVQRLRSLGPDEQLEQLQRRMQATGLLPPDAAIHQVRGFVRVFKANNEAIYTPTDISLTRIVLFRPDIVHPDYDFSAPVGHTAGRADTLGWDQFSSQPVPVHVVPGNHITMMADPNVRVVAEHLQECLCCIASP